MNYNIITIITIIGIMFLFCIAIIGMRQIEIKECLETKSVEICKKEIKLQFGF